MKKAEFLNQLKASLWALPEEDRQCSLDYYSEMIDDRMEDGLLEEEAVAAVGSLDEIVKQILSETPRPPQVVPPQTKKKQSQQPVKDNTKTWLIILLILGCPVWGSLGVGLLSTVFGVYVSLWAVVISLYAVFLALAASVLGCIVASVFMIGSVGEVTVAWGAALLCAGLSILFLLLANLAAKGMVKLTKWCWDTAKGIFKGKERAV